MKTYHLPGGIGAELTDGVVTLVELDGVKIHHLTTVEGLLEALDAMADDGEPLRDWLRREMKKACDTARWTRYDALREALAILEHEPDTT